MSRLVLVRHGRTAWNHEGRAQGHRDVPLDEVGFAQAAQAARALAALEPSALWSSDLIRARQTAEAISEATGLQPQWDPRLREFDAGARSGLTVAEFAAQFPEAHAAWQAGHITGMVEGAETPAEVAARMVPALRELAAATAPGATTVVVAHGACLKVALAGLLGWPEEVVGTLGGLANGGWIVLEDAHDGRGLRLSAYNQTSGVVNTDPDFTSDSPVG